METVTLQEAAELELLGAERRLERARAELEFFLSVAQNARMDSESYERQLHALRIELDAAARQVRHCREIVKQNVSGEE